MRWGTIGEIINKCVVWLSADWFVALCSLLGVLSFIASFYAAIKARNIDKTLNKYKVQQQFKKDKKEILNNLKGVSNVINKNELSPAFVSTFRQMLSYIQNSYFSLLPFIAKIVIVLLIKHLGKPYQKLKINKIANQLDFLIGSLQKKEG